MKALEQQFNEISKKINIAVISYHCNDGFNREETIEIYDDINWMLQTNRYRDYNLQWLELMASSLDLIINPDFYNNDR